jgi:predicted O-methyltransferase YrrM
VKRLWKSYHACGTPQVLQDLRVETSAMNGARMQVTPEQGQLMTMLAKVIGAKRYIEVGVFTGMRMSTSQSEYLSGTFIK